MVMKSFLRLCAVLLIVQWPAGSAQAQLPTPYGANEFMVLCYHDVPKEDDISVDAQWLPKTRDDFLVDRGTFVETIEYLRLHGHTFVSFDDVLQARDGVKPLPPKAVLLTVDDGYQSFYDFVFPVLKLYRYPCVLAIVTSWVEQPLPSGVLHPIMSWEQLREVADSGLVEIASHTHASHQGVLYNPQGNDAPAITNRRYDASTGAYETLDAYRERLRQDFLQARDAITSHIGVAPRIMVWPYGKYNALAVEEARRAGFSYTFALNDKIADIRRLDAIDRIIIYKNPTVVEFSQDLKKQFIDQPRHRAIHVDLDTVYDLDPEQQDRNLGLLLDRVADLKPSFVILKAFENQEHTGEARTVYFPNRVLPVKADLFNRVVHQIKTRSEVPVLAGMPLLAVALPDQTQHNALRIQAFTDSAPRLSESSPQRLSPFCQEARQAIRTLYEDLASHANIDGVVFLEDGQYAANEDFHPEALDDYAAITGDPHLPPADLPADLKTQWEARKTRELIDFSRQLMEVVRYYRPETLFGRTLHASALTDGDGNTPSAGEYASSLEAYDFVVLLAYPMAERTLRPNTWLKRLVADVSEYPQGLEKTVFNVQSYDWKSNQWLDADTVRQWLRTLVAAGARHVGYYPDNYRQDLPRANVIRFMISTEDFPFQRAKTQ